MSTERMREMIRAGIIGSTGYAGQELVRILLGHKDVEIKWYGSRSYIDQAYASVFQNMFQIVDDILDVTATTEELGKPVGSDAENDKTTFITLYGLEGARSLAKQHNDAALAALADLGPEADFLREMAVELLTRSK